MSQPETGKAGGAMGSVASTFRVLEEVARRQPIGLRELARYLEMPKSTVHRCLVSLREVGWLYVVDPERARWGITSKPLAIGLAAAGHINLRDVADAHMEELRAATKETVHMSAREGDTLVLLVRKDGLQAIRTFIALGTKVPIHATSSGVAVMSRMSAEEVETVLDQSLEKYTDATPVSRETVLAEVGRARELGYAVNGSGWWRPEVGGISAAVVGGGGQPLAAVTISLPVNRLQVVDVAGFGQLVAETAGAISKDLQHL